MLSSYKLEEITTVQELRANCSKLFKLNSQLKNPGVRCYAAEAFAAIHRSTATPGLAIAPHAVLRPAEQCAVS